VAGQAPNGAYRAKRLTAAWRASNLLASSQNKEPDMTDTAKKPLFESPKAGKCPAAP